MAESNIQNSPQFAYIDSNNSGFLDSGDACEFRLSTQTIKFEYNTYLDNGYHQLTITSDPWYKNAPIIYHEDHGFLFRKDSSDGQVFVVANKTNPLDLSAYHLMSPEQYDLTAMRSVLGVIPELGHTNYTLWGVGVPTKEETFADRLKDFLNDPKLLETIGYEGENAIDDLYDDVYIMTEGEFLYQVPVASDVMSGLALDKNYASVASHFLDKPIVFYDSTVLEKVWDEASGFKKGDLKANFVHEFYHTKFGIDYNQVDELPDDALSRALTDPSEQDKAIFEKGREYLLKENSVYKHKYESSKSEHGEENGHVLAFYRCWDEFQSYCKEWEYIFDQNQKDFSNRHLLVAQNNFLRYFEVLFEFREIPAVEELIQDFFSKMQPKHKWVYLFDAPKAFNDDFRERVKDFKEYFLSA